MASDEIGGVMTNGKNGKKGGKTFTFSIGAIIALLIAVYSGLDHKAQTSLDVISQHGQEFNLIREDNASTKGELKTEIQTLKNEIDKLIEDRFTEEDWGRENARIMTIFKYLELENERLRERVKRCEEYHMEPHRD